MIGDQEDRRIAIEANVIQQSPSRSENVDRPTRVRDGLGRDLGRLRRIRDQGQLRIDPALDTFAVGDDSHRHLNTAEMVVEVS